MKIGTYYYPEQWPRDQWERDLDNIKKMGLTVVHMGEFAWFDMEPSPGQFKLDWLEDAVDLCAARGLEVILCTPSASPPIWLAEQHPETLPVTRHGTATFGGRRHYNPLAPAMREATARIVTALADRFGDHPAIIGWQLDNEYANHFDQSDVTHRAFQDWLKRKYATIDALNKAWGNQFWNAYYTDFAQVRMPRDRDHEYGNPHQRLDASRFWSWAWADFNKLQADILKPKVGDRWITTNYMSFHPDANPGDMSEDLSMYTWNSYPVHGFGKIPHDETHRIGDPNQIGLMHDTMRSYTGRFGMLELQPGQVNWSPIPMLVYPGAVRLWLWTAFAHGAEVVTTYRYRQPLWGVEQWHHGLVGTDGFTPSPSQPA
jgi:beta-galactosidase